MESNSDRASRIKTIKISHSAADHRDLRQSTTLRYDPNGGAGTIADQKVGVGTSAYTARTVAHSPVTAYPRGTRSPTAPADSYKPVATITIDKPTTLYAQWVDITQPALPETGGAVNDHYLLKTIGGAASSASCYLRCDAGAEAGSFVRKGGVTC